MNDFNYQIYDDNGLRKMSEQEKERYIKASIEAEKSYWSAPFDMDINEWYDFCVDREIRKQYSSSQEFAILRQFREKPEEYSAYYQYCEQCKQYVKDKIREYGGKING